MFEASAIDLDRPKSEFYAELAEQLQGLLAGERDPVANAANTAALLFMWLPHLNWAGFYFTRAGGELVLGPFQGRPACVRIAPGRGVCGAAASAAAPMRVDDVHAFPDHIACDAASRSELVVPLLDGRQVRGVIDLDSPVPARFDSEDEAGLVAIAALYVASCSTA